VDLSQIFSAPPRDLGEDRLPAETLEKLRAKLAQHGTKLASSPEANEKLTELRRMYEPYVFALANRLSQTLPPWIPDHKGKDNWQTTAWARTSGATNGEAISLVDDHF
jgi:hypothetical protein